MLVGNIFPTLLEIDQRYELKGINKINLFL